MLLGDQQSLEYDSNCHCKQQNNKGQVFAVRAEYGGALVSACDLYVYIVNICQHY